MGATRQYRGLVARRPACRAGDLSTNDPADAIPGSDNGHTTLTYQLKRARRVWPGQTQQSHHATELRIKRNNGEIQATESKYQLESGQQTE